MYPGSSGMRPNSCAIWVGLEERGVHTLRIDVHDEVEVVIHDVMDK